MLRADEGREAAHLGGERQKVLRADLEELSGRVGLRVEARSERRRGLEDKRLGRRTAHDGDFEVEGGAGVGGDVVAGRGAAALFEVERGVTEMTFGERWQQLTRDVVAIDHEQRVGHAGGHARTRLRVAEEQDGRRHDDRRCGFPDRRGHATDEEGGPRGRRVFPARGREIIAPVTHGLGPCRRLEPPRDGIELPELGGTIAIVRASVVLREGIEAFQEPRESSGRLPAIVASRETHGELGVIEARTDWRIGLKEQIGARDLAVEVLRELERACRERRAPLRALGLADLSQPAILQHRQQHDQPQ